MSEMQRDRIIPILLLLIILTRFQSKIVSALLRMIVWEANYKNGLEDAVFLEAHFTANCVVGGKEQPLDEIRVQSQK